VNERDKVVSDGRFIFAAYGDVLQVWSAHGSTEEVSITQMPGDVKDCDPDKTELCISSTKPSIQALFLGNGRLIAVVSQNFDLYGTFDPSQFFDATKLAVIVYDVSDVTLGSPLNELAHKELPGSFIGGGSIGDKAVIVTSTDVHAFTWAVTEAVERSQPQYCGLNTTAYIELAKSTIKSLSFESTAKQMVTALDNANGCSDIVHVSTMQVGSIDNVPDLTESDFLLGSFVQLFTLDVSSAAGEIPATVTKTFSPSGFNLYLNGYNPYLTNDFVALPSTIYNYNSTTDRSYS
jgi:DNA excision repair protein ERCC-4